MQFSPSNIESNSIYYTKFFIIVFLIYTFVEERVEHYKYKTTPVQSFQLVCRKRLVTQMPYFAIFIPRI
jgi:hypothetical protein